MPRRRSSSSMSARSSSTGAGAGRPRSTWAGLPADASGRGTSRRRQPGRLTHPSGLHRPTGELERDRPSEQEEADPDERREHERREEPTDRDADPAEHRLPDPDIANPAGTIPIASQRKPFAGADPAPDERRTGDHRDAERDARDHPRTASHHPSLTRRLHAPPGVGGVRRPIRTAVDDVRRAPSASER